MIGEQRYSLCATEKVVESAKCFDDRVHLLLVLSPILLDGAKITADKCERLVLLLGNRLFQLNLSTFCDCSCPERLTRVTLHAKGHVRVRMSCFNNVLKLFLQTPEHLCLFGTPPKSATGSFSIAFSRA